VKAGKKPTVRQSKFLAQWGLNPSDWLVSKDTPVEMVIVHRHFGKTVRKIFKG
jgi:hypothetical protein